MKDSGSKQRLFSYLKTVIEKDASDLHLSEGWYPTLRVDGELQPLESEQKLSAEETKEFAHLLMSDREKKLLEEQKAVDFSYTYKEEARFRINAYYQKGFISVALRLIPSEIRTIEELHLPENLHEFCYYSQGFFMVCGPTGHGKTTALAAMINEINHKRRSHVITIENPIEYLFPQRNCIIEQREVGRDTPSFSAGLKYGLRQDPDVIMVGEMRDRKTMAAALTAAETGHLVFATIHTNDAPQTIDRIVDSFPSHQQNQIRSQLSSSLLGVLSRRLIPKVDGGRINAVELLVANSAVKNLIRENKIYQIPSIIETSSEEGMISLNRSLAQLVRKGVVSMDKAESYSQNPTELKLMLNK